MPESFQTQAYLLNILPRGKESALLLFLTQTHGKIALYQKGFYGGKTPLASRIDFGQTLELSLVFQEHHLILREIQIKKLMAFIPYDTMTCFQYLLELLAYILEEDPQTPPSLFENLQWFILSMEKGKSIFNGLLYMQYRLLLSSGFAGEEFSCSHCGRILGQEEKAFASPENWEYFCSDCHSAGKQTFVLPPDQREILKHWKTNERIESAIGKHFPRESALSMQKQFLNIFEPHFPLKSLGPMRELLDHLDTQK